MERLTFKVAKVRGVHGVEYQGEINFPPALLRVLDGDGNERIRTRRGLRVKARGDDDGAALINAADAAKKLLRDQRLRGLLPAGAEAAVDQVKKKGWKKKAREGIKKGLKKGIKGAFKALF